MTTLAIDIGNINVKSQLLDGKIHPVKISPSCSYLLQSHERTPRGSNHSPLVTFDNQSWVLGRLAEDRQGLYNFTSPDKVLQTQQFLYGEIEKSIDIDRLLVSVPDATQKDHITHLNQLKGNHSFTRNGQTLEVSIESIQLVDETLGAYLSCLNQNLFTFPALVNVVLTIGGGTVNITAYDGAGNVVGNWVSDKGLYVLASRIGEAVKQGLLKSPPPASIMDAMGQGKFITQSGVNFEQVFQSQRDRWIEDIRSVIGGVCQQLPVSQFAIVGGAAPLFTDYATHPDRASRFIIPPNPHTIAIEGLQYL
jgi:Actin like proteins N terminal domain